MVVIDTFLSLKDLTVSSNCPNNQVHPFSARGMVCPSIDWMDIPWLPAGRLLMDC